MEDVASEIVKHYVGTHVNVTLDILCNNNGLQGIVNVINKYFENVKVLKIETKSYDFETKDSYYDIAFRVIFLPDKNLNQVLIQFEDEKTLNVSQSTDKELESFLKGVINCNNLFEVMISTEIFKYNLDESAYFPDDEDLNSAFYFEQYIDSDLFEYVDGFTIPSDLPEEGAVSASQNCFKDMVNYLKKVADEYAEGKPVWYFHTAELIFNDKY